MPVSYKLASGPIGAPDIAVAGDTTLRMPLGTVVTALDTSSNSYGEAEFVYVKFTGTVANGDLCNFDRNGKTCVVNATSATKGFMGMAMGAQTSGCYGYLMVRGVHDAASVLSGATVGVAPNYGSAVTAGRVTSAVTANYIIEGCAIRVTGNGSNVGTVELYYPMCTGR